MTAPPPLLTAGYLLFWGYYAAMPVVAAALALALEGSRLVGWRWRLDDRDFDRTVDLTNVLFVLATVYLFTRDGAHGIFSLMGWLPVLMFPLILVQTYSEGGRVPAGALFLSLRRQRHHPGSGAFRPVDLGYPYLALCLLAAAAGVTRDPWFYPALLALTGWTLAGIRPPGKSRMAWLAAVAVAGGLGWAGHAGMRTVQAEVETLVLAWLGDRAWEATDPYRSVSAIGHIGRLKLSDRILLHVMELPPADVPLLLRQATYQRYAYGTWTAPGQPFEALSVGPSGTDWRLGTPARGTERRVRLGAFPRDGELLLALPAGTWRLDELVAEQLLVNPVGTVKAVGSPDFVLFEAASRGRGRADAPPAAADLEVPAPYREVVGGLTDELDLAGLDAAAAVRRLERFFTSRFRYSLWQREDTTGVRPLQRFLTTDRHGHCEYFATAGVLLLRAAGLPARYATGFSVQEYNPLVGHHVVRRRHAHAWAQVWDGSRWRDADFTPPAWAALEAEAAASWWQPAADLLARASFALGRWRWREEDGAVGWTLWLLPPLLVLLAWRLARQRRVRRQAETVPAEPGAIPMPADTPFAALCPALAAHLGRRRPGETLARWVSRPPAGGTPLPAQALREAVDLHNRLRFSDRAREPDRRRLAALCAALAREMEAPGEGTRQAP